MRKKISFLFFFVLILTVLSLGVSCSVQKREEEVDFSGQAQILSADEPRPLTDSDEVINIVIFICFADEDVRQVNGSIPADIDKSFNGAENSVGDYYSALSYGDFTLRTVFPVLSNGSFAIYKDEQTRSYYNNNKNESGMSRTKPEGKLLENAVTFANAYFSFGNIDIDSNDDGCVDCITFLISGNYHNDRDHWGRIMWPHSWSFGEINASATLGGVAVNHYTFQFLDAFDSDGSFTKIGLACHELGHAVGGLPDLYHYNHDTSYLPVGYWDLMHLDCVTPQFMTTYMRWKYLGFVGDDQVAEMTKSGRYELTPTTVTSRSKPLAYRITVSETESIWIEYRRKDVSVYDKDLPGSGLLVYRVNTSATLGNQNAKHHSVLFPEELFVYRPSLATQKTGTEKEKENLSYAYVSLDNQYFSHLGDSVATGNYDSKCIYLTNGKNTGIVITVEEENTEHAVFNVALGKYDASEIESAYVLGKDLDGNDTKNRHDMYLGESLNIKLYVKYRTRSVPIRITDFETQTEDLTVPNETGSTAYVTFTDEYGSTYKYPFTLRVFDKMLPETARIISYPTKTSYVVGETFSPDGLSLQVTFFSGEKREIAYSAKTATFWHIVGYDTSKSGTYTVFVTYDGTVSVSFPVVVKTNLVSMRIDEKNTNHIRTPDHEPVFRVIGLYADGMEYPLERGEYNILPYNTAKAYVSIPVTLCVDDIFCETYVYNATSPITSMSIVTPPKTTYRYGEALSLSDGRMQVSFENGFSLDGEQAMPLDNYYDLFAARYSPIKVGKQTLSFSYEKAAASMTVSVQPSANDLLLSSDESIRINEQQKSVLLFADSTLSVPENGLKSYLSLSFVYRECEMTSRTYGDFIGDGFTLVLKNADGVAICEYAVVRVGDTDGDGVLTTSDVQNLSEKLLEGSGDYTADVTGDGLFTLTDLILLAESAEGK